MLGTDPTKRISAIEALNHPYLTEEMDIEENMTQSIEIEDNYSQDKENFSISLKSKASETYSIPESISLKNSSVNNSLKDSNSTAMSFGSWNKQSFADNQSGKTKKICHLSQNKENNMWKSVSYRA